MAARARLARWLVRIGAVLGALFLLVFYLLYAPAPPKPELSGAFERGTLRVGALERRYLVYSPTGLARGAPLLVVFHGSMGSPERIRAETGYEFERLADRHGFAVAYPQGHGGHWNDCRKKANYAARRLDIDDGAFFAALVERLRRERGIDPARVFVAGLSNGGHFVFRLMLEHPERVAGAAVFAANLPTPDNNVCISRGTPPPLMLVNGRSDPLNPYRGGVVSLFGFGNRGTVMSAPETARHFAAARRAAGPPVTTPSGAAQRSVWSGRAGPQVVLLAIARGGHSVPQPHYRASRLLGRTERSINGPVEAWAFFASSAPGAEPR